jgi:hypothetical protein
MSNKRKTVQERKPTVVKQEAPAQIVDRVAVGKTEQISEERIYEENAKITAIFWEWRHKIMTHFFGAIGAVIAVTGWLYQQASEFRVWHYVPLLVGAAYSFISYLIDKRHNRILRKCYRIGADIELQARKEGAIFSFINDLHYTKGSLTQILHIIYLTSTLLFLGLSLLIIIVKWRS